MKKFPLPRQRKQWDETKVLPPAKLSTKCENAQRRKSMPNLKLLLLEIVQAQFSNAKVSEHINFCLPMRSPYINCCNLLMMTGYGMFALRTLPL